MQGRGEQQQGTQQVRDSNLTSTDHLGKDTLPAASGRVAGEVLAAAPLLLTALLLLVAVWWDGAFDLRYWAPLSILALALLLALALAGTLSLPSRGPLAFAVAALWGLAGFALLSAAWSPSPAAAWEGGARAILYAAVFTLAASSPAAGRGRAWVGTGLVLGVVAIGVVAEVRLLAGDTGAFLAGRLNDPIGYRNGTAALFSLGAWPLLGFAARRGEGAGLRAAAFAAALLLTGLAFVTQSRGMLLGLVCGGVVSLAIGPDRVRRSWLAIALAALVAVGSWALLAPYDGSGSGTGAALAGDVEEAGLVLLLLCGVAYVGALLAFVFDNGLRSDGLSRGLRSAATAGLVFVVAATGAVALAKAGDPVGYAGDKWDEFRAVESSGTGGGTRLGTVSGPRYDVWRVALDSFGDAPVAGEGEGSFRFAYYRERRTDRNLDDAHSQPLRLLAETGLIGFGLYLLWLVALGFAIAERARLADSRRRTAIAGLAAAGTVVVAQSAVDWLWLIPALFGLAMLALGLAARDEAEIAEPRPWGGGPRAALAAGLAIAILSATALFLSGVYVRKARERAASSPAAALDAARTAARLDPLSVTPHYLQAGALESEGRRAAARRELLDALDLEQDNFVTLALLGDLEVRAGNEAVARRYYSRALAQNPLDTGLQMLSQGETE